VSHIIYCPSCAAKVGEDIPSGEALTCPICGTEFQAGALADSAEGAIVDSDRPPEDSRRSGESQNISDEPRQPIRKRLTTEQILLARLQNEPPAKKPIPWSGFAVILVAILVASIGVFNYTAKPDKFAPGQAVDSTEFLQKRLFFQHIIDSLQAFMRANPNDTDDHLKLADAYYDASYWDQSMREFQTYLRARPADADARVDYAYAIAQGSENLGTAIAQIDTALQYKPDHLNALINAGILSAQMITDSNHVEALARSRQYFERAKAIAEKSDPKMAARIDTLLVEINNTGKRMAKE